MVLVQWIRACIYLIPLFALSVGHLEVWHIYAVQMIVGLVSPLYVPANHALTPTIVMKSQLKAANAYLDSTARLMTFLSGVAFSTNGHKI